MHIHFISIGGALMHNLALALSEKGHIITGSDDEIYEPSRSRLAAAGLLPDAMGWDSKHIHSRLDAVIVGMHARTDNPELKAAQGLGLRVFSYPEYLYQHSKNKQRIVVAGSHGKTTTTGILMHVLNYHHWDFDYAIGAAVEGFDTMVRLSNTAPIMVIEGDEYSTSPTDSRPKIAHYHPHIAVLTGIAWDHANVYPTAKKYQQIFKQWIAGLSPQTTLVYCQHDKKLRKIAQKADVCAAIAYQTPDYYIENGKTFLKKNQPDGSLLRLPLQIFGEHNLQNIQAAQRVCKELGMSDADFYEAIGTYKGAAGRLQKIAETPNYTVFRDFAHAPSKVAATVRAVKMQYPHRRIIAVLELHTFSSLNADFIPQYAGSLALANEALVYYNPHTVEMKKLPTLQPEQLQAVGFHPHTQFFTNINDLQRHLQRMELSHSVLLGMSSGNWGGVDIFKALKAEV